MNNYCLLLIAALVSIGGYAAGESRVTDGQFEYRYDRFPDFGYMLSPADFSKQYPDHVPFRLSARYPTELPGINPDVQRILALSFNDEKGWREYIMAVRDYVYKGNIHPQDNALSFNFVAMGQDDKWFHMPWQHWGVLGREGFHGLTKEGPLVKRQLGKAQDLKSSAYAVAFYNERAGYALGQVWKDHQGPDLSYIAGNGFPEGAVMAKFLFTTLDEEQVPYLSNPVEWNAYVYACDVPGSSHHPCEKGTTLRMVAPVRLLQMDIMVKDNRATLSNGWVFGTFVYNGALASEGVSKNERLWRKLQPVGVMWGNDPGNATNEINPEPTQTVINHRLKETIINDDPTMPAQHLGWNGRLNGPADNPKSSCMSCHSTAQFPAVSEIMPFLEGIELPAEGQQAGKDWMRWFRNFNSAEAYLGFDPGRALPTDFSLQLSQSIGNFVDYRHQTEAGYFEGQYWSKHIRRGHFAEFE